MIVKTVLFVDPFSTHPHGFLRLIALISTLAAPCHPGFSFINPVQLALVCFPCRFPVPAHDSTYIYYR